MGSASGDLLLDEPPLACIFRSHHMALVYKMTLTVCMCICVWGMGHGVTVTARRDRGGTQRINKLGRNGWMRAETSRQKGGAATAQIPHRPRGAQQERKS